MCSLVFLPIHYFPRFRHIYLVSTAQTTIEFYGNMDARTYARESREVCTHDSLI